VLATPKERLFFAGFSFKCRPLQEVMGVFFGLSQPQVRPGSKRLTPRVNAALGRELCLPARRPANLEQLLRGKPEVRLLVIDGAGRPGRRPGDEQRKKDGYSAKKKAHRKKNLSSSSEKRVAYPGPWK
jgi:hypothetical protein